MGAQAEAIGFTLTRSEAFMVVEGLVGKPFCSPKLVCDACPLNLGEWGLEDCAITYLAKRLEQLKEGDD